MSIVLIGCTERGRCSQVQQPVPGDEGPILDARSTKSIVIVQILGKLPIKYCRNFDMELETLQKIK